MAVTITPYNHTLKLFLNQEVDLSNIKVILLNASGTFTATHTATTQVTNSGAYEVSGNGWDAGGELLSSVAASTVTTNDAKLDADDLSITATGGDIGPAENAVVVDATSGKPLYHISFGEAKTAGVGTPFNLTWNANGISTHTYT
jgi:hypothetical protein